MHNKSLVTCTKELHYFHIFIYRPYIYWKRYRNMNPNIDFIACLEQITRHLYNVTTQRLLESEFFDYKHRENLWYWNRIRYKTIAKRCKESWSLYICIYNCIPKCAHTRMYSDVNRNDANDSGVYRALHYCCAQHKAHQNTTYAEEICQCMITHALAMESGFYSHCKYGVYTNTMFERASSLVLILKCLAFDTKSCKTITFISCA